MTALLLADAVEVVLDGALLLPATGVRLDAGERLAVLGPNGAGKTTLLRVLAGRLRPSSGAATLRGEPLDERRRTVRREVAALLDPPTLYPDLTLAGHLELIVALWAAESRGEDPAVPLVPGLGAAAFDVFELGALCDRFPHELSSGQRQLVALALTFARPANALLLDEPEQRLDPHRRGLLAEAITAAGERGAAVAFAAHDAELVARAADRSIRVGE